MHNKKAKSFAEEENDFLYTSAKKCYEQMAPLYEIYSIFKDQFFNKEKFFEMIRNKHYEEIILKLFTFIRKICMNESLREMKEHSIDNKYSKATAIMSTPKNYDYAYESKLYQNDNKNFQKKYDITDNYLDYTRKYLSPKRNTKYDKHDFYNLEKEKANLKYDKYTRSNYLDNLISPIQLGTKEEYNNLYPRPETIPTFPSENENYKNRVSFKTTETKKNNNINDSPKIPNRHRIPDDYINQSNINVNKSVLNTNRQRENTSALNSSTMMNKSIACIISKNENVKPYYESYNVLDIPPKKHFEMKDSMQNVMKGASKQTNEKK